ncbi:MAG TPA: hypothetical protein VFZ66_08855 [Herpetosiphonaceae bacterium]
MQAGTSLIWELEGATWDGEVGLDRPFDTVEELELAAQLLEITDEAELDQFIGKLFKKLGRGIKNIARPLGGVLKAVAKKALPLVGGALGSFIPIPGVGTAVGTALGSAVSKALEAELEGVDPEDRAFELARRFVRLAGAAAQHAARMPEGQNPQVLAQQAVLAAARQVLPPTADLAHAESFPSAGSGRSRRSGRWIRRGNAITLIGL